MNNVQQTLSLILTLAVFIPVYAQCPKGGYCVNVARITTSGEQVRGPVTIVLKNVNVVRYDVKIGATVTFTAGPDLSKLGFIPQIPSAARVTPPPGAPAVPVRPPSFEAPDWKTSIQRVFNRLQNNLKALQDGLIKNTGGVNNAIKSANDASTEVLGLVRASDSLLQTEGGSTAIISKIEPLVTKATTALADQSEWRDVDIAELAAQIEQLKGDWAQLPTKAPATFSTTLKGSVSGKPTASQTVTVASNSGLSAEDWVYIGLPPDQELVKIAIVADNGSDHQITVTPAKNHADKDPVALADKWSDWYGIQENKTNYDAMKSGLADLASQIAMIGPDSDKAKAYKVTIAALTNWQSQLSTIQAGSVNNGNPFEWSQKEGCGFAFSNNKQIAVVLNKVDRLAPPPAPVVSQEIVTVVCSSPVTISAGFGFAKLKESNFDFVQSAGPIDPTTDKPTVVSKIGLTSQSNFRVVPAVLINTRIYEFDAWDQALALHFSSGAAVSLSSGAVGNEVEYIFGGSLSFRRSVLVTIGGEVGRQSTLAGGFNLDDVVPTGLSSPPLQKKWALGPAIFITYIFR